MRQESQEHERRPAEKPQRPVWTSEAIRDLGAVTDIETAASILGIGRTKAYELAQADEFPVKVLHVGRRLLIPTAGILELVGMESGNGQTRAPRQTT